MSRPERKSAWKRSSPRKSWWMGALVCWFVVGQTISARGQPIVAAFERFHGVERAGDSLVAGGELLLNELNCVACHAPPAGWRERLKGRGKIALAGVGNRLPVKAMRAFVGDP